MKCHRGNEIYNTDFSRTQCISPDTFHAYSATETGSTKQRPFYDSWLYLTEIFQKQHFPLHLNKKYFRNFKIFNLITPLNYKFVIIIINNAINLILIIELHLISISFVLLFLLLLLLFLKINNDYKKGFPFLVIQILFEARLAICPGLPRTVLFF